MESVPSATRFARLSRPQAVVLLTVAAVALVGCLFAPSRPPAPAASSTASGGEDLQLYRRIVERVRAGEGYHDAAGDELRRRGYPTGSVFNWRLPTYAWVLASLPDALGVQLLLGFGVLAVLLLAYDVERREGSRLQAVVLVVLLVGAFFWCVDGDAFFAQELWAAVLIALSVCGYARGCWPLGIAAGLAALFFRELALPYAVIAAAFALWEGRWREVLLWVVGLGLYALFMIWHFGEVTRRLTAADRVEADGWVQFGGAAFILSTVQMNAFLFRLPRWVAAVYLVLSLVGLAGWRGRTGTRIGLSALAYVMAFAVAGKPMNNYWGLLDAPLLAFGIVHAPIALREFFRALLPARMTCDNGRAVGGSANRR